MSRIAEYLEDSTFPEFKRDYKTVDAVIRNFEIIGEASKNLPIEVKIKYPEVPWDEMYLLRNKVSHEYFGVQPATRIAQLATFTDTSPDLETG
ncbi:MAG: hypothetical protein C0397_02090 [Odoribacter sp.]|nr:hypothetical protein [Odoribacter sp.]